MPITACWLARQDDDYGGTRTVMLPTHMQENEGEVPFAKEKLQHAPDTQREYTTALFWLPFIALPRRPTAAVLSKSPLRSDGCEHL